MALTDYRIVERALGLVAGVRETSEHTTWDKFAPKVTGLKARSGLYAVEDIRNWYGDPDAPDEVAPGAPYTPVIRQPITSGTYATKRRGYSDVLTREDILESERGGLDGMDLVERSQRTIQAVVDQKMEAELFELLLDTTNTPFATTTLANLAAALSDAATGTFWDAAGANPLNDLIGLADVIYRTSGVKPNGLMLSYDAALIAALNADVRGYVGTTSAGIASGGARQLTMTEVSEIINRVVFGGAGTVMVMSALANTANLGQAASLSVRGSGTAWMGRVGSANATITANGVTMDPVSIAYLEFEAWERGQEQLRQNRGQEIYMGVDAVNQAIDLTTGYHVSNLLSP